jgi:integrase
MAKAKFIAKASPNEIDKCKVLPSKLRRKGKHLFYQIFQEWLSLKRGNIGEKEIKRFESNFNNLPEELRYTPIFNIRAIDLDTILKDVQPRKYEELRTLFNGIFKYATATGVIQNNPVALIKFKRAERQNREALSEEEIKAFLKRIKDVKYDKIRQFAYILYFFGLRPCEIDEETHREGEFLIARNRKRKNGKIEYKKIPIPMQVQGLIDWDKPLTTDLHRLKINDIMKELLDGKTAYCLRHTFATTCQQYVRPDIVDIWMGDSPTRLVGRVYTHFPDEFMLENMMKVEFPLE